MDVHISYIWWGCISKCIWPSGIVLSIAHTNWVLWGLNLDAISPCANNLPEQNNGEPSPHRISALIHTHSTHTRTSFRLIRLAKKYYSTFSRRFEHFGSIRDARKAIIVSPHDVPKYDEAVYGHTQIFMMCYNPVYNWFGAFERIRDEWTLWLYFEVLLFSQYLLLNLFIANLFIYHKS